MLERESRSPIRKTGNRSRDLLKDPDPIAEPPSLVGREQETGMGLLEERGLTDLDSGTDSEESLINDMEIEKMDPAGVPLSSSGIEDVKFDFLKDMERQFDKLLGGEGSVKRSENPDNSGEE